MSDKEWDPKVQRKRCRVCGRFVKYSDPRRALSGNPEKKYHGYSGARHDHTS